jgi:predicted phage terminase large subunit-like protein
MRITLSALSEIVSFADPASGRLASTGVARARTAIVTVGQSHEGHAFVIDAWADRVTTDAITDKIFEIQDRWKANRFGIEASAQQTLYVDAVIREANLRRKRIAIVPIAQPTTQTKEFRITTIVQKWLHNGLIYFNETLNDLMREMRDYPEGRTCDIVDALASALYMLPDPFASRNKISYTSDIASRAQPWNFRRQ